MTVSVVTFLYVRERPRAGALKTTRRAGGHRLVTLSGFVLRQVPRMTGESYGAINMLSEASVLPPLTAVQ